MPACRLFKELATINAVARVALSGTPLQVHLQHLQRQRLKP